MANKDKRVVSNVEVDLDSLNQLLAETAFDKTATKAPVAANEPVSKAPAASSATTKRKARPKAKPADSPDLWLSRDSIENKHAVMHHVTKSGIEIGERWFRKLEPIFDQMMGINHYLLPIKLQRKFIEYRNELENMGEEQLVDPITKDDLQFPDWSKKAGRQIVGKILSAFEKENFQRAVLFKRKITQEFSPANVARYSDPANLHGIEQQPNDPLDQVPTLTELLLRAQRLCATPEESLAAPIPQMYEHAQTLIEKLSYLPREVIDEVISVIDGYREEWNGPALQNALRGNDADPKRTAAKSVDALLHKFVSLRGCPADHYAGYVFANYDAKAKGAGEDLFADFRKAADWPYLPTTLRCDLLLIPDLTDWIVLRLSHLDIKEFVPWPDLTVDEQGKVLIETVAARVYEEHMSVIAKARAKLNELMHPSNIERHLEKYS